jgi:hypothetical protein
VVADLAPFISVMAIIGLRVGRLLRQIAFRVVSKSQVELVPCKSIVGVDVVIAIPSRSSSIIIWHIAKSFDIDIVGILYFFLPLADDVELSCRVWWIT